MGKVSKSLIYNGIFYYTTTRIWWGSGWVNPNCGKVAAKDVERDMFETDLRDVERLRRDLADLNAKAWPYANRYALNGMAFAARTEYRAQMEQRLTLRNRWTLGSVGVQTARGTDPKRQFSVAGSRAPYMADQEFGATTRAKGRTGVPIPTSRAAGQARGAIRTRLPSRRNRLAQIKLGGKAITPKNEKQRLVLLARQAVETGRRYFFLNGPAPRRGIYHLRGGSLRTHRGWPTGAKLEMMWDLSRPTTRANPRPMLGPAADLTAKKGPAIYVDAITQQIERQRLFRGK